MTHRLRRRALRPGDVTVTRCPDSTFEVTIAGSTYQLSEENARTLAVDLADAILTSA